MSKFKWKALPNASSERGSQMGRGNTIPEDAGQFPCKFHVRKLPLVDGDYDQGGAYWGATHGTDIYQAVFEPHHQYRVEIFTRATSPGEAQANIRALVPTATFYKPEPPPLLRLETAHQTFKLRAPFIITARLMAGLVIGGATISLGYSNGLNAYYRCFIDLPDGQEFEDSSLRPGACGGTLQQGFAALLSFLGAAAESYHHQMNGIDFPLHLDEPDNNSSLFPRPVTEWAYQNSDEISMLQLEIEESETPLIEE